VSDTAKSSAPESDYSSAHAEQPAGPPPVLYIFGAGDVSVHVAAIASHAGFQVSVIDERPGLATVEKFPAAAEIYTSTAEAMQKIQFDANTYLLLATRTHEGDLRLLDWALRAAARGPKPRYIGMIGKKRKVASIYKTLQDQGIAPAQLESVYAPVGLEIGAETPAEIAISIVAELIALRRNSPRQKQQHKSITLAELASESDPAT
jgi:xanthine dehydrogenase accessory factor